MQPEEAHIPVLLEEAVRALAVVPNGVYLDATYGRGGHACKILSQLDDRGRLLAVDQDPEAVAHAKQKLAGDSRFQIFNSNFSAFEAHARGLDLVGKLDGMLLDLGVSSPQLDDAERGFSFSRDGALDMRMNPEQGLSAAEWLMRVEQRDLSRVLKEYGDERYAGRISRAIIRAREEAPLHSTLQLAEIIKAAHPRWEKHKHPATRSFQAIRIEVNAELDSLKAILASSLELLKVGGKLVVISFHSLEDRMVKRFIRAGFQEHKVPRGLPPVLGTHVHSLKSLGKPVYASDAELDDNVRARSAVLRVAEKFR